MGETRVFADGYRGVFQNQEDFLACLNSIGRNSFWERKTSKNLRLVAITSGSKVEEELKQMYADEGLDEDIITDTVINTGLLLKIRNQYYPVRDCAIKSILDRAGISGAGLRRVEKSVYARILNDCLKVAKGDALLRISEGKVSAVLGGDCHDYAVLDMEQVFLHSVDYLRISKAAATLPVFMSMTWHPRSGSFPGRTDCWMLIERNWRCTGRRRRK